jgi:hypothetical protein
MECLQTWFRQAPLDENAMYDDDPAQLVFRRKTCPCCRAVVRSRPIPVFLVKNIVSSLAKAKGQHSPSSYNRYSNRSSPSVDGDPWEGLFPCPEDDDSDQDYGVSDEDFDDASDEEDSEIEWNSFGTRSRSDEEPYREYASPLWEPPTVRIRPEDIVDPRHLSMLRRGVTEAMIEKYDMQYTHDEGLIAVVDDGEHVCRIYLGWNITLREEDRTGKEYIGSALDGIYDRTFAWHVEDLPDGGWVARRLMPVGEVEVYDSDAVTDAWTDDDDDDDDMD